MGEGVAGLEFSGSKAPGCVDPMCGRVPSPRVERADLFLGPEGGSGGSGMAPRANSTRDDAYFMRRALRIARLGLGRTHPNPRVGAIAVQGKRIVAWGAHLAYGRAHAEAHLLARADGTDLRGATLYVTLEPCAHVGKTPACAPAVAAAGFRRAVVATGDPHPQVCGRGLQILRRADLDVSVGLLERQAKLLNAPFFWFLEKGRAFVTLKIAASLDGRLAAADGSSRWVTRSAAREQVQHWRAEADAILVGRGTFEADGPRLTARPIRDPLGALREKLGQEGTLWPPQPVRVLLDSEARVAADSERLRELRAAPGGRWLVVCGSAAPPERIQALEEADLGGWVLPSPSSHRVDLQALCRRLAADGLLDVMVEGGGELATAFIRAGLVERYRIFCAPVLLGGGRTWTGDLEIPDIQQALRLAPLCTRRLGPDVLIEALSPPATRALGLRAKCFEDCAEAL